jgi:hypothetical protein
MRWVAFSALRLVGLITIVSLRLIVCLLREPDCAVAAGVAFGAKVKVVQPVLDADSPFALLLAVFADFHFLIPFVFDARPCGVVVVSRD